jgi:hypothetical protein
MLEYALKQERYITHLISLSLSFNHQCNSRLKFNKLKYGSETVPLEDQKPSSNEGQPAFDDGKPFFFFNSIRYTFISDDNKDDSNLAFGGSSVSFKQGRQLLRQYE